MIATSPAPASALLGFVLSNKPRGFPFVIQICPHCIDADSRVQKAHKAGFEVKYIPCVFHYQQNSGALLGEREG